MKILLIIWLVLASLQTSGFLWSLGTKVYPIRKFYSRGDHALAVWCGVIIIFAIIVVVW